MDSKIALTAASLPIIEASMAFAHQGAIGAVIGLGATAMVYVGLDELQKRGREISLPQPSIQKHERQPGEMSAWYRMTHGKDARGETGDDQADQEDGEQIAPGTFPIDDVVGVIRELNARGLVYFGDSLNGAVAIPLNRFIHGIDVSASGQGKSNRLRLIMPQVARMAETYYINPLANELKSADDEREVEVWTPIFKLLKYPEPVREADDIDSLLSSLVQEVNRRHAREKAKDFGWKKKPIFVFIDELPMVYGRCTKATEYLEEIGRIGRQFKVYCYLCTQTAQVKESGLPTSFQSNIAVRVYGGSDETSGARLIKVSADIERAVRSNGPGLTYMLAGSVRDFVRAPLVTNEGLFELLDLPPFKLSDWYDESTASISTSGPTSKFANLGASNQPAKDAMKQSSEAEGSSTEVVEAVEAVTNTLSERERLIIELFTQKKLGMRDIAIQLCGADGGNLYIKTSKEVTDVIREYLLSLRG